MTRLGLGFGLALFGAFMVAACSDAARLDGKGAGGSAATGGSSASTGGTSRGTGGARSQIDASAGGSGGVAEGDTGGAPSAGSTGGAPLDDDAGPGTTRAMVQVIPGFPGPAEDDQAVITLPNDYATSPAPFHGLVSSYSRPALETPLDVLMVSDLQGGFLAVTALAQNLYIELVTQDFSVQRSVNLPANFLPYQVFTRKPGEYYVGGVLKTAAPAPNGPMVVKYDAVLGLVWSQTWGSTERIDVSEFACDVLDDGGVAGIVTTYETAPGSTDEVMGAPVFVHFGPKGERLLVRQSPSYLAPDTMPTTERGRSYRERAPVATGHELRIYQSSPFGPAPSPATGKTTAETGTSTAEIDVDTGDVSSFVTHRIPNALIETVPCECSAIDGFPYALGTSDGAWHATTRDGVAFIPVTETPLWYRGYEAPRTAVSDGGATWHGDFARDTNYSLHAVPVEGARLFLAGNYSNTYEPASARPARATIFAATYENDGKGKRAWFRQFGFPAGPDGGTTSGFVYRTILSNSAGGSVDSVVILVSNGFSDYWPLRVQLSDGALTYP
jgi:hypothetical protein